MSSGFLSLYTCYGAKPGLSHPGAIDDASVCTLKTESNSCVLSVVVSSLICQHKHEALRKGGKHNNNRINLRQFSECNA